MWSKGRKEEGSVNIGGESVDISRVVGEHKDRFIDTPGGYKKGDIYEVLPLESGGRNKGYVIIEGNVVKGTIRERRAKYDSHPERQRVFEADDGSLSFVISSDRITS